MTERERVEEHIKVLSILYYINAGMHLFGVLGGIFYAAMGAVFRTMVEAMPARDESAEFVKVFVWFFVALGGAIACVSLVGAVCNFLSARWLRAKTHRTFSLVVAAITCINIPLGTVLGVFTFIILAKPEALEMYDEAARGAAPAA